MEKKQTKLKVVVRVRPKLSPETKDCVEADHSSVEIFNHRNIHENIKYEFSSVYNKTSSQLDVFNGSVLPMMNYPLEGQNISIFAYGPTGAGKTHTMLGSPCNPGIIPRVVNHLFTSIREEEQRNADRPPRQQWTHTVTMSFLEIYNEKVQDLLERSKTDLPIREDSFHNIFVAGLAEREIKSFDDFKMLFAPASNNRTVASTKLNDHSSRSHSILLLKVRRKQVAPPCVEYQGKIYLIDLAGSEDNRRTGNKGIRLKESGAINKSLFALGEVVDAINNNLPRIPYRNSKLTRLLQDSIGGSCHSLMITNIAPEEDFYYDTYCTLNFASKSKKIVNTNTTNVKETAAQQVTPPVAMAMKRPASSETELVIHKRRKMSPATSSSAPPSSDPAPLLSPLMKRQTTLERTVNNRLEEMEQNILQQIRHLTSQQSQATSLAQLQQQLQSFSSQLSHLQHLSKAQRRPALNDKTNMATKGKPMVKQRSKGDLPSKATAKPKEEPKPKPVSKPKEKAADSPAKLLTKKPLDPEMQKKHNAEFLQLLNRASVKELQELHTVGNKRARLIWEWREMHGTFATFDDLQNVPGFTIKYVGKLLQSNWVQLPKSS